MTVGSRIKARRQELGLSVEEVADKLNRNRATVYRYESDDIENLPITILEPLAMVLQTTPANLMGWNETSLEVKKEQGFNHFLEQQMRLLGYEIIYDDQDGYIFLIGKDGTYEISQSDIDNLQNNMKSYLNFKLHELMTSSRKVGGSQSKTSQFLPKAARNDAKQTEQEKALMNEDLDEL